jgi:hypothetical protein
LREHGASAFKLAGRDDRSAPALPTARSGGGDTSVRNAVREAERLGLVSVEERRLTAFRNDTNIVRIVAPEWRSWLRLRSGQGGGCKFVQPTNTVFTFSVSNQPSSGFKKNCKVQASESPPRPPEKSGGAT